MPMINVFPSNKKKIVVGVNTLTAVDQSVYSNHCQFWFRLGRSYPEYDFILVNPRRMSIDHMRNMAAKMALDNKADYLLFMDDDVLVPIDGLAKLLQCNADIAAGWTIIRGYPFKNMHFKFMEGSMNTALEHWEGEETTGVIPVDAVGFSFALINCELLRLVKPPFFVTGTHNTEDIYFCMKSREFKKGLKIVVDLDVKTSHNLGSEYIDPLNKSEYKKYMETITPTLLNFGPEEKPEARPSDPPEDNTVSYEELLAKATGLSD